MWTASRNIFSESGAALSDALAIWQNRVSVSAARSTSANPIVGFHSLPSEDESSPPR